MVTASVVFRTLTQGNIHICAPIHHIHIIYLFVLIDFHHSFAVVHVPTVVRNSERFVENANHILSACANRCDKTRQHWRYVLNNCNSELAAFVFRSSCCSCRGHVAGISLIMSRSWYGQRVSLPQRLFIPAISTEAVAELMS
jgi:hypothetical protein